jgi:hypothetical protein
MTLALPQSGGTTIYRTTDNGNSWQNSSAVASKTYISGAFGNGIWIVLPSDGAFILSSTDGITFTQQTPARAGTQFNQAVASGNGFFVATQVNSSTANNSLGVINL